MNVPIVTDLQQVILPKYFSILEVFVHFVFIYIYIYIFILGIHYAHVSSVLKL